MLNYLDKTYTAAIYLRLSKEDGDLTSASRKTESNSIANQRKLIQDYVKHHPEIASTVEFCDDGFTGANFNRPDFQRMIQEVRQQKINCIIVKDLSRFGRDYIESGRYIEKIFPAMGVRFIAINDNYDSAEKEQAGNEIILPFKNLINDSYSRDISIKVRSNLDIKRRNGEFVGTHVVYGYMRSPESKNQLVIDKEAAAVVERIYRMKIDGYSPAHIADQLNEEGIPSPSEYKRLKGDRYKSCFQKTAHPLWSAVAIYRILKEEMYTGTLVQGKSSSPNHKVKNRTTKDPSQWVRVPHAHDAIIPPVTFDLVQKLMKENTRSSEGEKQVNLFSGKVRCADCGSPIVRCDEVYGYKHYVYLICSGHLKNPKSCVRHTILEQTVYDTVLAVIQSQVAMALELEKALKELGGVSWERREMERIARQILRQEEAIEYAKKMKANIYEDFKQEFITLEEYNILKADSDQKIADAKAAIAALNGNRNKVSSGLTGQQSWISQFKKYKNIKKLTRRVVVYFIDHIEINKDLQIHVFLNNADQFQAIQEFLQEQKEEHKNEAKEVG